MSTTLDALLDEQLSWAKAISDGLKVIRDRFRQHDAEIAQLKDQIDELYALIRETREATPDKFA